MSDKPVTLYSTLPRNSLWNALATAWQTLVTYLMVPFVIALAGDARYGLWVLLSTLSVTGALGFLDLGLTSSVVKWIAQYKAQGEPERAARVLDVGLAVFVPLGLCVGAVLFGLRPWLLGSFDIAATDRAVASTMIAGLAIQVTCDFIGLPFASVAQAYLRFGWLRALQSIRHTVFGLVSVLALRAGYGIEVLAYVSAALAAMHVPLLAWLAHRNLPEWSPRLRFPREEAGPLVKFSAKILALRVSGTLYRSMDKLILGALLGTVAVKNYDIVYKVHALSVIPAGFISPLIVPLASQLFAKGDRAGLRDLVLQGSKITGALCIPIAAATLLLAEPLLVHWLGPQEAEQAGAVRLFATYMLFWPLAQVGWNALIGMNLVSSLVTVSVVTIGSNFVLSVVLVGPLGMSGVIVATVVTNAVAFVWYLALQLRALELSLGAFVRGAVLGSLWPTLGCTLVLLALLALHRPSSLFETLAYLAVGLASGLAVFAVAGLNASERARLLAGLQGRTTS